MPTMRPPSLDLLRALRAVTTPSNTLTASSSTSVSRQCQRQRSVRCIHPDNTRYYSTTHPHPNASRAPNPYAPKHRDRGPTSTEDTQTDFGRMDVLANVSPPATSIDACTTDGFHLDNGVKTEGGTGIVLVGGEAFEWAPWRGMTTQATSGDKHPARLSDLLDPRRGILNFPRESLGLLELLHPKPDLLIVGTGGKLWMLSKETRAFVSEYLGCRLDVMDTANAAAAYNLLAKERGIEGGSGVGGLFLPIGWVGPQGAGRR